jgi:hypothetical protein
MNTSTNTDLPVSAFKGAASRTYPGRLSTYNKIVLRAYTSIVELAKQTISGLEKEDYRHTLATQVKPKDRIVHEFVNPLLYLRLYRQHDDSYAMNYGFEPCMTHSNITLPFVKGLHKLVQEAAAKAKIDNCIRVDWYFNDPDELYEFLAMHDKDHTYALIEYNPSNSPKEPVQVS